MVSHHECKLKYEAIKSMIQGLESSEIPLKSNSCVLTTVSILPYDSYCLTFFISSRFSLSKHTKWETMEDKIEVEMKELTPGEEQDNKDEEKGKMDETKGRK